MDKCSKQWVQQTDGCQADANGVDDQCSIEILKDYSTAVTRDANSFDKLHQVVANENYVGAFAGHIGSCPHGHSDRCFTQGWSVIDTITNHCHDLTAARALGDLCHLCFGKEIRAETKDA